MLEADAREVLPNQERQHHLAGTTEALAEQRRTSPLVCSLQQEYLIRVSIRWDPHDCRFRKLQGSRAPLTDILPVGQGRSRVSSWQRCEPHDNLK